VTDAIGPDLADDITKLFEVAGLAGVSGHS